MKKLTHGTTQPKNTAKPNPKPVEQAAEKADAKCCAKTSKNRVGCHD